MAGVYVRYVDGVAFSSEGSEGGYLAPPASLVTGAGLTLARVPVAAPGSHRDVASLLSWPRQCGMGVAPWE